ncbi:MAG: ATP-dependent DNA helicase RecG [Chloroflexi bacterium]|nr:ATP-dependent DNA helicase RecG [Chloroflexota bacterium]
MQTRNSLKDSPEELLEKILLQEKAHGFKDSVVLGGLDRFLQRLEQELRPLIGDMPSYSDLTPVQREEWVSKTMPRLNKFPDAPRPRRVPPRTLSLEDDVSKLRGVTPANIPRLRRLGLTKIQDLLYLFPHRHNDFANIRKIAELTVDETQTIVATVWEARQIMLGNRRSAEAILGDDSGNIRAVWFNQPYLAKSFKTSARVVISGRVNLFRGQRVFESPEYELLHGQEELIHTGRLVPVYPLVEGLGQRTLRRWVKQTLDSTLHQVADFLPEEMRHRAGLMGLENAIAQAHYPETEADQRASRTRLAFDELFLMQLAVLSRKREWQQQGAGIPIKADQPLLGAFFASLPFTLTSAQERAIGEILKDMEKDCPMSRLLQGEVGSGKTLVALVALLTAASNSYQGALMAPTEILAEQHFITTSHMLSSLGRPIQEENLVSVYIDPFPRPISLGLLIGSLSRKAKEEMQRRIAAGSVDIVIGTHALIQQEVAMPNLALAVVDEQHRFGVMQRSSLRQKGKWPHLLAMSATPIPRSLALTLYGDLDISVLDQLPAGRQEIQTRWVVPEKRRAAYNFLRQEISKGRQAFVICPLIEGSDTIQAKAAVEEHEKLSRDVFPDLRLGLLHGRMAMKEKEEAMDAFRRGELDILVSTPVIEVGIDVPNATVVLIDGADRFGLAQLHQFRGRVGRGQHKSYCILLADAPSAEARERLKLVEELKDGFALAEADLRFRGPGDYLGTRQSGLPDLRVARISDVEILALARREASNLLDSNPHLEGGAYRLLSLRFKEYSAALAGEMS